MDEALELLRQGRAVDALPLAEKALASATTPAIASLPALILLAEIHLELGSPSLARTYFRRSVALDPSGLVPSALGDPAEKFLWLAQLSETGGQDSVSWYTQGAAVLRRELSCLPDDNSEAVAEKRLKLANALCGVIEVYMTDLSWDPSAEATCESLISEALHVAPVFPGPLQTLASIRISQGRLADARNALRESMALWRDDDTVVPEFATLVSLARLLMEVGMEEAALGVVERLVGEDDGSVEGWYLGGWCLYLLGGKRGVEVNGEVMNSKEGKLETDTPSRNQTLLASRSWLQQALALYTAVEYEDTRLRDHARELVEELDHKLGPVDEDEDDDDNGNHNGSDARESNSDAEEDEQDGEEQNGEEEERPWEGLSLDSEEEGNEDHDMNGM